MMNTMVKKLVMKDLYFFRKILAAYILGGLAALAVIAFTDFAAVMIGGILFIAVIMSLGIHLVMGTIINERKLQTLPFVMSLPISVKDYTLAKIIVNVAAFLVPWLILVVAGLTLILGWDTVPNGVIPFLVIMLIEIMVAYFIILAVGIITESEGWTIATVAVCNTAFSLVFFATNKLPGVIENISGPMIVWPNDVIAVLALEFGIIAAMLAVIFYVQNRKNDFL